MSTLEELLKNAPDALRMSIIEAQMNALEKELRSMRKLVTVQNKIISSSFDTICTIAKDSDRFGLAASRYALITMTQVGILGKELKID